MIINRNRRKESGKLAVWGWWQGNNLGDNWIKCCLSQIFPKAVFISTDISCFNAYSFVLCGGGGLFIRNVPRPWRRIKTKTPFGALGLGAEFEHKDNNAKKLADKADFFFVRDQYSVDCMHLGDKKPSRDITFSAPLSWMEKSRIDTNKVFFVWRDGSDFIKSNADDFIKYGEYRDNYNEFWKILSSEFSKVMYDDFQTASDNIADRINDCGFVISGRFHGIVAAIQKGLPCIAIDICPKIRALMQDCRLEKYCIKMSEVDKLKNLIQDAKKNQDFVRQMQLEYRNNAIKVINEDITFVKKCLTKRNIIF